MLQLICSLLLSIVAVGCSGPRYVDYFPCHDDGSPKPKVVFVPVVDVCATDVPWDVSQELTNGIRYEIMDEGELFLYSQGDISQKLSEVGQIDFFTPGTVFAEKFCDADFIVLTELLCHQFNDAASFAKLQSGQMPCYPCRELSIKMRIKVIDLRCRQTRIAQQEIFSKGYLVSCQPIGAECGEATTGNEAYQASSVGQAHQRLANDIATRLGKIIKSAY